MGKMVKRFTAVALALVLLVTGSWFALGAGNGGAGQALPTQASAQAGGTAPLKVEVKSNKDKYTLIGKMTFTATITNTSNSTVNNISAEALLGKDIFALEKGSQLTATRASLAPGQSFSFSYVANLSTLDGLDMFFFGPLAFFVRLFRGSALDVTDNGFNDGRAYMEASKSVGLIGFYKNYDASTKVRVWYGGTTEPTLPTTYYESEQEHMVFDSPSDNLGYVDNIILVWFKKEATDEDMIEVANSINGAIVGSTGGEVQIKIAPTNKEALKGICQAVSKHPKVQSAIHELVLPTDSLNFDAVPNDPWTDTFNGIFGTDWNENNPNGLNWWLEAIYAPSAWDFNNRFSRINIGIVDSGFDTEHEDLNITVLNFTSNSKSAHGTHVAGIVGATANNNKGITGIVWNADLYGVCTKPKSETIVTRDYYNAFRLLLDNKAKVINFSISDKSIKTEAEIEEWSDASTSWIGSFSEMFGDDFIIVQAAGNESRNARHGGFFASMDNQLVQSYLNEHDITSITAEEIMSHVIIVGATDKPQNGQYTLASSFSNYGSNVDIVAPGVDIFSTDVMGGLNGNAFVKGVCPI